MLSATSSARGWRACRHHRTALYRSRTSRWPTTTTSSSAMAKVGGSRRLSTTTTRIGSRPSRLRVRRALERADLQPQALRLHGVHGLPGCRPPSSRRRQDPEAPGRRRHLPGQRVSTLRGTVLGRSPRRLLRWCRGARSVVRRLPQHAPGCHRQPLPRALPAADRPPGPDLADQGHRTTGPGPRGPRRLREGPRRERDDRRPDAQRPRPGQRPWNGARRGHRPSRTARRSVALGVGRRRHAGPRAGRRNPAARDVPTRLGDRGAEGAGHGDHPRGRVHRPRDLHRCHRLCQPGRRSRAERRHPDLRVLRRAGVVRRRRRSRHRLDA